VCGSKGSKDDGELIVSRVVSKQRFERLDEGEFFHGAGVECQTPAAREPLDHDVCRAVWQLTCPQSHAAVDSAYAWRASLPNVVHGPERGMQQPDSRATSGRGRGLALGSRGLCRLAERGACGATYSSETP
jgi:hypothetical protein